MTTVIGIGIGIFSIAGIIAIIFMRKRRKKMQEEKFQATKKVREDSLKQALANNLNPSEDSMAAIPYRPYKVDYSTGENQNNGEKLPLLQLIEKNKLSEKKYKKYKFNKLGTYRVEYSVANPYNKKAVAKKVTVITVKDTKKPKLSGVSSKKNKEYKSVLNLRSGVTAKLVSGKNMTSKIVIKVKAPSAKKYKTLSTSNSKKYCFTKVGVYSVEYSVANPYNKKAVAKKVMKVTVKDTKAPVISGVNDQNAALGDSLDLRTGVIAKLLSGKDITDQMTIEVTTPEGVKSEWTEQEYRFEQVGEYTVTYTAVNPEKGKKAQAVMKVTVTDERMPKITIDPEKLAEISTGASYEVMAGVTAVLPDQTEVEVKAEITGVDAEGQTIEVPSISKDGTIVFETAGTYTINYTAVNPNNEAKTITETFTLTVTLKNDEDPKPEDPKPEDPKPEDPKPEDPQELQEDTQKDSDTVESVSEDLEDESQKLPEDMEESQEDFQNPAEDVENPQQDAQDSTADLEDSQEKCNNL